jgi:formate-dependent nitrite reductase membrane component NrfD
LKRADIAAIIVEIVLIAGFLVLLGNASQSILSGLNGILLLGGTVVVGLLIPLAIHLRAKSTMNVIALVSVLILIGGFLMRMVIVLGGQGLL